MVTKKIHFLNLVLLSFCAATRLCGQADSSVFSNGFVFEAAYVGDNVNNLSGGIKQGSCYLGMANFRLLFDSEKAGLWKGGQFFINAANTHGAEPSANLVGDMQVASNIEAGDHTFIQELWFKQNFKHFEITVGLQDLNVEFAASDYGSLYLNSSFGILPVISANVPAPIFPLTSLGITAKWTFSDKTTWLLACYDGNPTDFDYNPYNLNWQFNSGDGILIVSEIQQKYKFNDNEGTCKLGIYNHNHLVDKQFNPEFPDSLNNSIFGVYTYVDQVLWQKGVKELGFFAQLGYSPSSISFNNYYIGLGINYKGVCSKSGSDILGLAVAHESLYGELGKETTLELSYQYPLCDNIFIQPDFQYIINPSGKSSNLKNAFLANLRFGFSF